MTIPNPWTTPTLSVPEAGALLGMGRSGAYEAMASGALPTVAVGSVRRRVPTAQVYALLGLPLPPMPTTTTEGTTSL